MTDTGIRTEGAKTLSEVLQVNTKLTSLNLCCDEKSTTQEEMENEVTVVR